MTEPKTLKSILYIEDEADIREVAKMAMEMVGGFTLKVCTSGAEAIEAIKNFPADLILLDVMMPGLDGPATLKKIQAISAGRNIPVIFMTAKVQKHEMEEYKKMGAIGVISKPFDPMKLSETIRALWERA